jgi:hypothetical protein
MSKEMINTNKAVFVYFPANKSQGMASIYIPFPVQEIHVKSIDVDWQADYCACMFSASLLDGTIGGAFCGVNISNSTSLKDLKYIFLTPRDINGTYTFNYSTIDTSIDFPSINNGLVVFRLEFIGYIG